MQERKHPIQTTEFQMEPAPDISEDQYKDLKDAAKKARMEIEGATMRERGSRALADYLRDVRDNIRELFTVHGAVTFLQDLSANLFMSESELNDRWEAQAEEERQKKKGMSRMRRQ